MKWKDKFPKENIYFQTDKGILYCGNCLDIMKGFPKDVIALIYIDPPYGIPGDKIFGLKWKSIEEHYKFCDELGLTIIRNIDKKGKRSNYGIAHYLFWIYPKLVLMKELLAEDGSIYVHLDYRMVYYVKLIMDEIFGRENFRNEIVWCYGGGGAPEKNFNRKHDMILFYSKTNGYIFNPQYRPYTEKTKQRGLTKVKGRYFEEGLREEGALVNDWWVDIQKILSPTAYENLKYPTQKPEKLLERIILASSNEGDIVADFFSGSGTLAAVAEKLGRKWIVCDINKEACKIAKQRILTLKQKGGLICSNTK